MSSVYWCERLVDFRLSKFWELQILWSAHNNMFGLYNISHNIQYKCMGNVLSLCCTKCYTTTLFIWSSHFAMLEIRQELSASVCVNSCTKNQQCHCYKMNDIRFLKLAAFLCRENAHILQQYSRYGTILVFYWTNTVWATHYFSVHITKMYQNML